MFSGKNVLSYIFGNNKAWDDLSYAKPLTKKHGKREKTSEWFSNSFNRWYGYKEKTNSGLLI